MGLFDIFFKPKKSSSPARKEGGPRVKTGPTRGELRSRKKTGEWRAKRSDAGVKR
jgi:hypothetical protein